MKYENWISFRYLTATQGRFIAFLNFISIAGVAIGVMALIVVTGIMTGFGNNLRDKIIGSTPHLMVEKEIGISNYQSLSREILAMEGVAGASGYIQGNIFIEESGQAMALAIRGIVPETEDDVTKVRQYLTDGKLENLHGESVIIGSELAKFFGYRLGDTITLISPGSGMAGQGWRYKLAIAGIFQSGMADLDMNLVLVNINQAQQIFGLTENVATGVGIKLDDPYEAREFKELLVDKVGFSFVVKTWIDINRNLFQALMLEKWGLFIILTLMILVASFNIISTLIVTVTSKVHDIGILKSVGVPKGAIRRIFTKQGLFIGMVGIFWGLVGGLAVTYILRTYVKVPKEIYYIDRVPVDIQAFDIAAIILAALIISFLATIYPASKAANLQPVDALRYE